MLHNVIGKILVGFVRLCESLSKALGSVGRK